MIGGFLLNPAERFPALFGASEFFKKYPYFLPCAVPATFSIVAWVVTYFFLNEVSQTLLFVNDQMSTLFQTVKSPVSTAQLLGFKNRDNKRKPIDQEAINGHHEGPCSETCSSKDREKPLPLKAILVPQVIIAAANYASLSLVDIGYRAVQPLFMSTPIELGGLGLPPHEIGKFMSLYGVLNGTVQVFVFPRLQERWGSKNVFLFALTASIPMLVCFPLLNYMARSMGINTVVWTVILVQIVLSALMSMAFGS
jgi:hypothetical protein